MITINMSDLYTLDTCENNVVNSTSTYTLCDKGLYSNARKFANIYLNRLLSVPIH